MSSLPAYAVKIITDPKWIMEKAAWDFFSAAWRAKAKPFIEAAEWCLVEYSAEDKKAMGDDDVVSFHCVVNNHNIRADLVPEAGPGAAHWPVGVDPLATADEKQMWLGNDPWSFFRHGTVTRPATEEEKAKYGWCMEQAISSWVYDTMMQVDVAK